MTTPLWNGRRTRAPSSGFSKAQTRIRGTLYAPPRFPARNGRLGSCEMPPAQRRYARRQGRQACLAQPGRFVARALPSTRGCLGGARAAGS